jgi:cellulose synthase/poly-beta-1,6-N-acetylglucosamine synthase-like glycosyltransferase
MSTLSLVILILIVVLVVHLREEVRTGFRHKLPFGVMPRSLFIGINLLLYIFCLAMFVLSFVNNKVAVPMAWAFSIAMLLNGAGHIAMMLYTRRYFPGGITAFLLLAASGYLVSVLAT